MPPVKRPSEGEKPPAKKTHPFFSGGAKVTDLGKFHPSPPSLIHFVHLDPFISVPPPSRESSTSTSPSESLKKIAISFYDLDGTLIKPRLGGQFPKGRNDWMWWNPSVPEKLKKDYIEGRHIVVISNQGDKREKIRNEWKAKLPLIAAKMPKDVPLRVLAALEMNDVYRKPNIGMFQVVTELYRKQGLEVDMGRSLFVGDAAGRPARSGQRKDHGDTDYKFAVNVGLKFVTPEEHFLGHPRPSFPEPPIGFRPSQLSNLASLPHVVPSHTPITRPEVEIVLFVGPPASGKSSFYRKHFAPKKYAHVNQDTLGTRDKCLRIAEGLVKEGKSIVVDNTNRNRDTRAYWISLASKLDVPIRVFHFHCPVELAKHNNLYRAYYPTPGEPSRTLLPGIAFSTFGSAFEEPSADEGFDEIRGVNFHFEGEDEQKKKWDMFMLEPKR